MTEKSLLYPDYLFEVSWEVCNLVGGIYTVLSTKAHTLQKINRIRIYLLAPMYGKPPLLLILPNLIRC